MDKLIKRSKSLETIIVLALASVLVFIIFDLKTFLYVGLGFLIIGIISKSATQLIHFLWMKFADILSYISSRIILSFVFYIILTPISLLYRISKKKALFSKAQSASSNFIERNHLYTKKDIENPW